jgi:hypothetical protein
MRLCSMCDRPMMLRVEAWTLVPVLAVAVRVAPGWVLRRLRRRTANGARQPVLAGDVAAAVERAAAWLPSRVSTCLPRACAAHVMLRRRGAASDVRIGILKTTDGMRAHAWVDAGGVAIGFDDLSPAFTPLTFP